MKISPPYLLLLLTSNLALEDLMRQPYGIHMCRQGTQQVVGMKSYKFHLVYLSCRFCDEPCLTNVSHAEDICYDVDKINFNHSTESRIIKTRRNTRRFGQTTVHGTNDERTGVELDERKMFMNEAVNDTNSNNSGITKQLTYPNPRVRLLYGSKRRSKCFMIFQIAQKENTFTKYTTKRMITKLGDLSYNQVLYSTVQNHGLLRVYNLATKKDAVVVYSIKVLDITEGENNVAYVLGTKRGSRNGNYRRQILKINSSLKSSFLGYECHTENLLAVSAKGDMIYISQMRTSSILTFDVKRKGAIPIITKFLVQTLMVDKKDNLLYYASGDRLVQVNTHQTVFVLHKTILSLHYFENIIFVLSRNQDSKIRTIHFIEGFNHSNMKIDHHSFQILKQDHIMFIA